MGYEIELSFDLSLENVVKHKLVWKANLCLCEYNYLQYDLEGRRKQIYRKNCVMTFIFPEEGLPMQRFIRYAKAMRGVSIECMATSEGEILFASSRYLSMMPKHKAQEYRKKRKARD